MTTPPNKSITPDLVDAAEVAKALLISLTALRRMSDRREYPPLLRVTRGQYRVRRQDHEAWMEENWTEGRQARAELLAEHARYLLQKDRFR
jgi:hypothetical protein